MCTLDSHESSPVYVNTVFDPVVLKAYFYNNLKNQDLLLTQYVFCSLSEILFSVIANLTHTCYHLISTA